MMEKKVNINQLGIITKQPTKAITINGVEVEVRSKISFEELLGAMQWSIAYIMDDRPFVSAPIFAVILDLAVIEHYTNIDLGIFERDDYTATDLYSTYDLVAESGLLDAVKAVVDTDQVEFLYNNTHRTLESIVAYHNSAAGLIDRLAEKAEQNGEKLTESFDILKDPENAKIAETIMKNWAALNEQQD